MPLPSSSRVSLLAVLALLAGCARGAPELPPDLSARPVGERLLPEDLASADAALDCPGLLAAMAETRGRFEETEGRLMQARRSDQNAGIAAALLFPPAALAGAGIHSEERAALDGLQKRRDRLDRLVRARSCVQAPT